jgi:DNA-binding beta-propeller fold protein YncE
MRVSGPSSRSLVLWAGAVLGCSSSKGQAVAAHPDSGLTDSSSADAGLTVTPVPLPNGTAGIGFDDLRYAPTLKKVLAPGGRSGNLDLVDPDTLEVTAIGGFSTSTAFTVGSHTSGTTSADEGAATLFAIDHETQSVRVVDPATRAIVATTMLAGAPDYVRWAESSGEIWVTEPGTGLEVLTVRSGAAPVHAATIPVTTGPEAIAVDNTRHRVYTNSFVGQTYAIDIARRTIVETWTNGCSVSLGIALDEVRGFLFVACSAGSVAVLDAAHSGAKLGEIAQGSGLDIISYSPSLHHLYIPGGTSADLAIVAISASGAPKLLGTVATAHGSQEVTADDRGNAWVADQAGGRLLKVRDIYPATP